MSSHHHHHLCHRATTACHCQVCYDPHNSYHHHPPPPPDHHQTHPNLYLSQSHIGNLNQFHPNVQQHYFREERISQPTVSSLLRRIDALESALRRRSTVSYSVRDAAASTIQAHFRQFLLRRSRTLRQLKELASIKSKLSILKSSVSEKNQFDYDVVYRKSEDLLLKLESIQGGDPMVRDGKRSISRELNNFMDFVEGIYIERRGLSSKVRYGDYKSRVSNNGFKTDNSKREGLKRMYTEKLRGLVEKIDKLAEELDDEESDASESRNIFTTTNHSASGNRNRSLMKKNERVEPKAKKSVSFVENGKVYRVLRKPHESFSDDDYDDTIDRGNSVNLERELENDLCREIEEIGVSSKVEEDDDDEENHSENGGSDPSSDKDSKSYDDAEVENFIFSAPLPVKMEKRNDFIGTRKK